MEEGVPNFAKETNNENNRMVNSASRRTFFLLKQSENVL